ncbi:hypothetical protein K438DRAFT_1879774 [Mycena galopus ATCC 62051]|nr:hypothetical protein K438DRAFT_1879774 [Mycena galopus ATCC 62051]
MNAVYSMVGRIFLAVPPPLATVCSVRKSMVASDLSWTLVPTEETLTAMHALQVHNFRVPSSERKSFLTEFSAAEYEYIFIPLEPLDFYILQPGQAPRRFGAPYTDFPLVRSSVNPFFVAFYSRTKIRRYHVSETWQQAFGSVKVHWRSGDLPEDFLLSCGLDDGPEGFLGDQELESDSEETVATPLDEGPSAIPDKETFVCNWVRQDASHPHERVLRNVPPPTPPLDRTRKYHETIRAVPRWRLESKRGQDHSARLFKSRPKPGSMKA